jgi:4-amino-4-deoxychorismate lyase
VNLIFIDGRFLSAKEATISLCDQGFIFGKGVFTSIRVENGKIECLERHLKRLKNHCESLCILFPNIHLNWISELVIRNEGCQGLWKMKMIITAGRKSDEKFRKHGHFVITLDPYKAPESPYNLTLYPHVIQKPTASIKSLAYLDHLLVKEYARQYYFDDAITISPQEELLETAFSNLFWCEENNFYTPNPNLPLLKGISLTVMIEVAEKLNMKVHYVHSKLKDIPEYANLFLSNAMIGFHPVDKVGERKFSRNLNFEKILLIERQTIISNE